MQVKTNCEEKEVRNNGINKEKKKNRVNKEELKSERGGGGETVKENEKEKKVCVIRSGR